MTVANLSKIDPLSCGKVLAAVYFALSLLFIPFFLLMMFVASQAPVRPGQPNPFAAIAGMGIMMVVVFPIIYTVLGFVGGIIIALVYNLAARFTGGFQLTFTEVPPTMLPTYPAPYPPRS